jgi:alpha-N-arabinofuranosidase
MTDARIKIDPTRRLGKIDRRVYGNFTEHLGRCIYGGIYEPGSSLSDENGFRRDVLEAVRALQIPLLRWPGGNFASGYHWMDGIGPQADRPCRRELSWGAEEPNTFGTHEFMTLCRVLNTEPYLCVNLGTGSIDEAGAWVEYCNSTGSTSYANLRRKNGAEQPFGVKLWGLGNEMYGHWQIGAKTADEYCRAAIECAKVMKWVDPTIELVSCGWDGLSDWDFQVMEALAPHVAYHSIHLYTGSPSYYPNVFAPHQAERALRSMRGAIEKVRYRQPDRKPIRIAYDEWNVWYRNMQAPLEEIYDLSDALAIATYLNIFQRNCDLVAIANLAQLVNVIAPIFTDPNGLFLQTIYHPLRLYAQHSGAYALDAFVDCDGHALSREEENNTLWGTCVWDMGPFPWLDVSATGDESGHEITLAVVNRSQDMDIETSIRTAEGTWDTRLTAFEVNGADVHATNSFQVPQAVDTTEKLITAAEGSELTYTFPAHSLTICKLSVG